MVTAFLLVELELLPHLGIVDELPAGQWQQVNLNEFLMGMSYKDHLTEEREHAEDPVLHLS